MRLGVRQTALSVARAARMLPHGVHLPSDLRRVFPNFSPSVIFDVGANLGLTVEQYLADFPYAEIHAFEPDHASFKTLEWRCAAKARCYNIGLADRPCRLRFDNSSPVHQIHAIASDQTREDFPLVDFSTVDAICDEAGIAHIGLLKIDAEGSDLDVIRGASEMLKRRAIDVVLAECAFRNANSLVPFRSFDEELSQHGYLFFGFYGQTSDKVFAYGNAAFISPALA